MSSKNIRKLTCGSAEIAKTTSDQINSRILESTYIVTEEIFSEVGLNSPKNGSKQANTDRKTRKKTTFYCVQEREKSVRYSSDSKRRVLAQLFVK